MAKTAKRSKKKRVKRNPKLSIAYLLLLAVFIGELLFITWCRIQSRKIESDIIAQTEKTAQLSDQHDRLKLKLAELKSPRRIAQLAKNELGLITPRPDQIIVFPDDE